MTRQTRLFYAPSSLDGETEVPLEPEAYLTALGESKILRPPATTLSSRRGATS